MFDTDKPIQKASEDKLGRGLFAERLATAILNYNTTEHYTVALQGRWGSGKTSVLNMTLEKIEEKNKTVSKPIVAIRFNPWNFTDPSQLLSQFFVTLTRELSLKEHDKAWKKVGETMENYSSALEYVTFVPVIGPWAKLGATITKAFGKGMNTKADKRMKDVSYQRKQVEAQLKELDRRLLIVIDDIDRLPNDQIRLIFQLVNAVAGFPNTIYLLSFDQTIVSRALEEVQKCNGDEYLEKIIQFPFVMPPINQTRLHGILLEKLEEIYQSTNPNDSVDNYHLTEVCNECVFPFIETIRDVNRFCNALAFAYSAVSEEVNFIDMMGICALQVFVPDVYMWVREQKVLLTDEHRMRSNSAEQRKKRYEKIKQEIAALCPKKAERVLDSIEILFPTVTEEVRIQSPARLHQKMRVADSRTFDLYFSLSVEDIKIGRAKLDESLMEMKPEALDAYLEELAEKDLICEYGDEAELQLSRVPQERVKVLAPALLKWFSRIDLAKTSELTGFRKWTLSISTFEDLFYRLEDGEMQAELFKKLFVTEDRLEFQYMVRVLRSIEYSYGKTNDSRGESGSSFISLERLPEVEMACLQRLKYFVEKESVLDWEVPYEVLELWKIIDQEGYKKYIEKVLEDETATLKYLALWIRQWTNGNGFVTQYELSDYLAPWIGVEEGAWRIERAKMTTAFWELPERKALAAFLLLVQKNIRIIKSEEVDKEIEKWQEVWERNH